MPDTAPDAARPAVPFGAALEGALVAALRGFNGLLHVFLAVALVAASGMVVLEFVQQVLAAFSASHMARGFLHALGILFIVWTLSSLISAEIEYIRTHRFHLRVFLDVAMITLLRSLIIEPIQVVTHARDGAEGFDVVHYGALLAAILVVGVVHRLTAEPARDAAAGPAAPGPGV